LREELTFDLMYNSSFRSGCPTPLNPELQDRSIWIAREAVAKHAPLRS